VICDAADVTPQAGWSSLKEALATAGPGEQVIVPPGIYRDALEISQPVEVVGGGPVEQVVIQVTGADAVRVTSGAVRLKGVTIWCAGPFADEDGHAGVYVRDGDLVIEDCVIAGGGCGDVAVQGPHARLTMRRCLLAGPWVPCHLAFLDGGGGAVEETEIVGSARGRYAHVWIREGCDVLLRECVIRDGDSPGVRIERGAAATLAGCVISNVRDHAAEIGGVWGDTAKVRNRAQAVFSGCTLTGTRPPPFVRFGPMSSGVCVWDGPPVLEDCTIGSNGHCGIDLSGENADVVVTGGLVTGHQFGVRIRGGRGRFESVRIEDCEQFGVFTSDGATPEFRGCEISGCGAGVTGPGRFTDCVIRDIAGAGVVIDGDAPKFRGCKISDAAVGVYSSGGRGRFESVQIKDCERFGVSIDEGGSPEFRGCKISAAEVGVHSTGGGTFDECAICNCTEYGVELGDGAVTVLRACEIGQNGDLGVLAAGSSAGRVTGCNLTGNSAGPILIGPGSATVSSGNRADGVPVTGPGTDTVPGRPGASPSEMATGPGGVRELLHSWDALRKLVPDGEKPVPFLVDRTGLKAAVIYQLQRTRNQCAHPGRGGWPGPYDIDMATATARELLRRLADFQQNQPPQA
jgi:Right handed beta helix region